MPNHHIYFTHVQAKKLHAIVTLISAIMTCVLVTTLHSYLSEFTTFSVSSSELQFTPVSLQRNYSPSTALFGRIPTLSGYNSQVQYEIQPHSQRYNVEVIMNDSVHSHNIVDLPAPQHHMSLFKSWSKGRITEITPLLGQNCSTLMAGNSAEHERVVQLLKNSSASSAFTKLSNCSQIMHEFHQNLYVSKRERSFPIAFSLIVYTNAEQILRFLKAIYRPHNVYCIHPDSKSGENFTKIVQLVSHCLPNVFIPLHTVEVNYNNESTIFNAQMCCLRELETRSYRKWKYVINLCGRELPLKTNRYIVESLMVMNSTSILKPQLIDMHTVRTRFWKIMHQYLYKQKYGQLNSRQLNIELIENNEEFLSRYGIKLYKSMAYNALSRPFVHYILLNHTMQLLMKWLLQNCRTPEEHFYAMAYMMPGVPGGFSSLISPFTIDFPEVSKTLWKHDKTSHYYTAGETCTGKSVHQVCILNTAHLPLVKSVMESNTWFFNKYFMEDDYAIMDCVEEQLVKANMEEFVGDHKA